MLGPDRREIPTPQERDNLQARLVHGQEHSAHYRKHLISLALNGENYVGTATVWRGRFCAASC